MADDLSAPDVSFAVARHGFDRAQVRQYVRELAEYAHRADAGRAEALTQVAELQGELEIARREVEALSSRLDEIGRPADEQSAARLVDVAKSQASEITTRARAAADGTWAAAERASTELRDKYRRMLTELDEQHAEIHRTHKTILTTARTQAEEMTTGAHQRRRDIDAAAERDRIRIDREFSERTAHLRASLERELTDRRAACVADIDARLRAADEEAQRRIDTVTAQVKKLTEVRTQLSDRLRDTQDLIERSAVLLEPMESEAELTRENPFPIPPPPGPEPEPPAAADPPVRKGAAPAAEDADPTPATQPKRAVPPQRAKGTQPAKR
ncbi:MAG: hypothetical protein GEV28_24565 [Actinophytocola sp.]|uniref:hypothetical protein n=1 Tax=Actinophytocola sp. TaxID=1872138 RepID=UPI001320B513|nr:hypothetical protein [Actinophytocola sp.]MPZ83393.1 hypothetical protein [Actinophytocola sp.]